MSSLGYILSPKLSDLATFTGSAVATNSSVGNLQKVQPALRAIFLSGSCYVEIDFGSSVTMDGLGVGFINALDENDTFQLRVKDTYPVTSSPLWDSTPLSIWADGSDQSAYYDHHRQFEFPIQTARYARVDFNCANPVVLSRLMLGKRVEPTHGPSVWSSDGSEPILSTVDLAGQEIRRPAGGFRRSLHMEWLSLDKTSSLGQIYPVILERGSSRDLLVALNHGDDEIIAPMGYVYIGCVQAKVIPNTFQGTFNVNVDLIEMAPLRMV